VESPVLLAGELLGVLGLLEPESPLELLELFESLELAPDSPEVSCFCGLAMSVLVEPERLSVR
jgi:hypothetical protein